LTSTKHHYTPRYYLKHFENAEGKIWRRDVETGAVVTGNSDHFGYKNHWNRLENPPPGYEADWAEKRIADIDGHAAAMVRRLVEGQFPPDIRVIAYAAAFMKMHQPRLHRELLEEFPERTAHWTPDFKLIASLKSAIDEGKKLEPLSYAVLRVDDEQKDLRFLTSSNPLVDFSNKANKFFPLSKRHCMMLIYDPALAQHPTGFSNTDAATVRGINDITLRNSWQYVYSCRADFEP